LNKLFERQDIGVMEYVILERLEQAARDLSSPFAARRCNLGDSLSMGFHEHIAFL